MDRTSRLIRTGSGRGTVGRISTSIRHGAR